MAVLLGAACAAAAGHSLSASAFGLTMAGALLAHAGANVVNDFHDREADRLNTNALWPFTGGSRMIQDGHFSALTFAVYGYLLLIAAGTIGTLLALRVGTPLWLTGAAGLGLAVAYSAPPLRLSGRGMGEPAIAAAWLLVVMGTDLVGRGHNSAEAFAAGLPFALHVAGILYVNGFPDRDGDAAAGKRTAIVRLDAARALRAYSLFYMLAYGWLIAAVVSGLLPSMALAGFAGLPFALVARRSLLGLDANAPGAAFRPAIVATIAAAHLHGLAIAAGLWIPRLL